MFGAIAMMILLPFIDRHPVRSARYRPWFRMAVYVFAVVFVILGICGSKPAEGLWVPLAQVMTLYYYGFFLALIPFFVHNEPVLKLPNSIHDAVLAKAKHVIALIAVAGLVMAFVPSQASAASSEEPNAVAEEVAPAPAEVDESAATESEAPDAVEEGVAPATETVSGAQSEASHDQAGTHKGEEHANAAGGHHTPELPKVDWHFDGPFGTFDRAALQRGFQVYKQVCSACHSMNLVAYRNLAALGYTEGQIKTIAAESEFTDGPDDEGEMFTRPGRPSDHFKKPYANDNQAKASNNGALPPDLSLIVKARMGGADYIHAILTGYEPAPEGTELANGQHWNKYMAGNKIAMPAPLQDGAVAYDDPNTPQTVEQYSKDVTEFLTWAANPEMEIRKQTGIKVLIFLILFAGVMYLVKRKLWAKVEH
jgi:cytochrome c1